MKTNFSRYPVFLCLLLSISHYSTCHRPQTHGPQPPVLGSDAIWVRFDNFSKVVKSVQRVPSHPHCMTTQFCFIPVYPNFSWQVYLTVLISTEA
jgi:hypothetical protein